MACCGCACVVAAGHIALAIASGCAVVQVFHTAYQHVDDNYAKVGVHVARSAPDMTIIINNGIWHEHRGLADRQPLFLVDRETLVSVCRRSYRTTRARR